MNALINSQWQELDKYKNEYLEKSGNEECPFTFGKYTGQEDEEERARMQSQEGGLKTDVDVKEDFFRLPAGDRMLVETRVTASVRIII